MNGCPRLTISVTQGAAAQAGRDLARRAGRGITMARVARAALDVGLDKVSEAMDRWARWLVPGARAPSTKATT